MNVSIPGYTLGCYLISSGGNRDNKSKKHTLML